MKITMNAKIHAMWLAALRSGNYGQGHTNLKRGNNYCCLGVLTDLAIKGGIGHWVWGGDDIFDYMHPGRTGSERCSLAQPVVKWAGLPPDFAPYGLFHKVIGNFLDGIGQDVPTNTLAGANDGMKLSFAEIADIIEREIAPV